MTYQVKPVPPELAAKTWPQVAAFVEKALKYSGGDYTLDQIKMFVCMGTWLLLVSVDDENTIQGAMTISFQTYPNDRVAYVTTTGGKGICTADALSQMKNIVASMGATKVQAGGRPSMVRMLSRLGFIQRYMVVEARI
jgi:hypothetical protein